MVYAMSDIHGCIEELQQNMEYVDLTKDNRIVFLGDYIDYGRESYKVLSYLKELQVQHGTDKVIVLKGNHEAMFLEWIEDFSGVYSAALEAMAIDSWLKTDSERRFNTFRTFISQGELKQYEEYCKKASAVYMNRRAVELIMSKHSDLVKWINDMPSFYDIENNIFVHAGIDEDAGEFWEYCTSDEDFLWKYPATFGRFYKSVIAGHLGTGDIANEKHFHDIYYDGASHYYIDGSVYKHGKLLLFAYDESNNHYYQIERGRKVHIKKYDKYR